LYYEFGRDIGLNGVPYFKHLLWHLIGVVKEHYGNPLSG
jgi:hypothetical protein